LSPGKISRCDGSDLRPLSNLHCGDDFFDGDVCDAEDAPFDFVNRHDVF